jgi:FkbM family methyltransferase
MMPTLRSRLQRVLTYTATGHDWKASLKLALVGALSRYSHRDKTPTILTYFSQPWLIHPKLLDGLTLAIDPLDWSETLIYEEIFIGGAYDLSLVPYQPDVVVDCGAHIGMFSLLAAARWKGVKQELFEPTPRNIQRLKMHLIRNQLVLKLNEGVVAAEAGQLVLEIPRRNSHSARIVEAGAEASTRALTVQAWSLPEHITLLRSNRLVLKLDVEGAEKNLWAPLMPALPLTCAIFFETHHHDEGWTLAANTLEEHGFEVSLKSDRGECKDGFALRLK